MIPGEMCVMDVTGGLIGQLWKEFDWKVKL